MVAIRSVCVVDNTQSRLRQRHALLKTSTLQPDRLRSPSYTWQLSPGKFRRCICHTAESPNSLVTRSPRDEVLSILQQDSSLYVQTPVLDAALERLIGEQGGSGGGTATLKLGQGTWEVFSAPHIARLSQAVGARFQPIQYVLKGTKLYSYVRFSSSIFKEGWLSASGSLIASDPDTVQVLFDNFWVDLGSNTLRTQVLQGEAGAISDRIVAALGRTGFLPQLSYFPVLYVDPELAVFSFPPLKSNIAVRRVPDR